MLPAIKSSPAAKWLRARTDFLAKEKKLTHLSDQLARERQELPRTKVEKDYVFTGPQGKLSLAQLFDGRSQLATYHFMFGPNWEEGCPGCSFLMDHTSTQFPARRWPARYQPARVLGCASSDKTPADAPQAQAVAEI